MLDASEEACGRALKMLAGRAGARDIKFISDSFYADEHACFDVSHHWRNTLHALFGENVLKILYASRSENGLPVIPYEHMQMSPGMRKMGKHANDSKNVLETMLEMSRDGFNIYVIDTHFHETCILKRFSTLEEVLMQADLMLDDA